MKTVHLCLVSDQPIPNLTTALQFKPDTVVLLYTGDRERQKERLERVLARNRLMVEARRIEAYGMANVTQTCETIIKEHPDCQVSLNITGGTKIGTLGAFQAFYNADLPIYYVNTQGNEILKVSPKEEAIPIAARIPVKDYLAAYGFTVESSQANQQGILARRRATEALRDVAIRSEWEIGKLNSSFPEPRSAHFPIETAPLDKVLLNLLPVLEQCGIAAPGRNGGLQVDTLANANYLRGFWFEELVYMAAVAAGADEVALNVEGKWDSPGRTATKNEFDVMIAKGNRLFFISCKTSNPNRLEGNEAIGKEYLYELDSLGDQALGLFGRKMLASARPLRDDYLKQRARVMKIDLVDNNDLHNLKGRIQQWLN